MKYMTVSLWEPEFKGRPLGINLQNEASKRLSLSRYECKQVVC